MTKLSFLFVASIILASSSCLASAGSVSDDPPRSTGDGNEGDLKTCLNPNDDGTCLNPEEASSQANLSSNDGSSMTNMCLDDRDDCEEKAARGECKTKPVYMLAHCKLSCNACPANLKFFDNEYGEPQEISGDNAADIEKLVQEADVYMTTKIRTKTMYHSVKDKCFNRDKLCSKWATEGECQKNHLWMQVNCAPACQTCEKLDHRIRCPVNERAPKAFEAGDIDEMFENIMTHPHYKQYKPVALSQPAEAQTGLVPIFKDPSEEGKNFPWVVALENFLTEEECDRLIYLGGIVGYKQSYEAEGVNFDGTYKAKASDSRNSFNAWCWEKQCYEDKITQQILAKIGNVTNVPEKNSEFFQILRYEEGGLYKLHSDYIPTDLHRAQGVRALTMLIYLNDAEYNSGGETYFPVMDLTIRPKKGAAILFPNVHSSNPDSQDRRTAHAAFTVKNGVKYAANLWIHQRDFKTPFFDRCN
ncbi:Prolyl 4-hydroxylase subunit alpha-2 [Seminavis robusta]|uniref:Prolyl 4-hydroxylase subunit alpha-2 n=1 Tax=Seminavis robusta TaxID=568900 RepID=A0A9N8DYY8_9STRA|nr:Prolyl 4-hydroxylase subunit alpha-2 [Seminavis robusta]|eukprot:Sro388_g132380.1 Prolyl 4-hydroxylase subunit alpha-2 (473) ;mRNA; r:43328-44966